MLTGPWLHVQPGVQRNTDIDMHALQLAWLDRWLKDDRNGVDETETPLHAIIFNPKDYPALLGGEYDIQRTGQAASFLTLPLAGLSRPRP